METRLLGSTNIEGCATFTQRTNTEKVHFNGYREKLPSMSNPPIFPCVPIRQACTDTCPICRRATLVRRHPLDCSLARAFISAPMVLTSRDALKSIQKPIQPACCTSRLLWRRLVSWLVVQRRAQITTKRLGNLHDGPPTTHLVFESAFASRTG